MAVDPNTNEEEVVKPAAATPPAKVVKKNAAGEDIDDDGMSEKQRKEALSVYTALSDPKRARVFIETLAREAGLLNSDDKRSDKTKKSEMVEMLEESLGEDYKFLAPKLGPVFDKILGKHKEELDSRFDSVATERIQKESDDALAGMRKDFADFKLFETAIQALMEEIEPGKNLTQKQYLTKLYKLAKAEAADTQRAEDKANRNRPGGNNVPPVGGNDNVNKDKNDRPKGIREAVTRAMETIEAGDD